MSKIIVESVNITMINKNTTEISITFKRDMGLIQRLIFFDTCRTSYDRMKTLKELIIGNNKLP